MSAAAENDFPFGPLLCREGVRFRAWAPGARRVELQLDPGSGAERRLRLTRGDGGFFERVVADAGPGTRYLLRRDDGPPLPDPAAPAQPEGVHRASEVVDHRFPWSDGDWRGVAPRDLVVYELHVGAFSAAGSYAGVLERLDHLRRLGVTAIKLMPLASCAGRRNWGYDGVALLAPAASYGTPRQLQQLVDACHAAGIAVLLDVVTNHFGPEGNAMWSLARSFFHRRATTPWGPGPRFDREPVLAFFDQLARHYCRHYHIDGLRLDAVHAIPAAHRRQHIGRLASAIDGELPPDGRALLLLESTENELSLLHRRDPGVTVAQLNFDFQRSAHRLLTGEAHAEYGDYDRPADDLASCLHRGFAFLGRHSRRRGRPLGEAPAPLRWSTVVNFLGNHDTAGNRFLGQRIHQLPDVDEAVWRAATALLLLHPGVPYLLMGQEWSASSPFFFFCDFSPQLGRQVARGRRRGFNELAADHAPSPAPPDPQDPAALERSRLRWDELARPRHGAQLAFTSSLLRLRARLRPQISDSSEGARARALGATLVVEIPSREEGRCFRLVANLGDTPFQAGPARDLRFCSAGALERDDPVPGRCTCLYEC